MKFLVKSIRENEKVSIEKINKKRDTKFIGIENDGYKNLGEIKSNKKLDFINIEGGVEKNEDISTSSTTLSSALLLLNPSNKSKSRRNVASKIELFEGFNNRRAEDKVVEEVEISSYFSTPPSMFIKSNFLLLFISFKFLYPLFSIPINFVSLFLFIFSIETFSFSRIDFTKNFMA